MERGTTISDEPVTYRQHNVGQEDQGRQRRIIIIAVVVAVVLLVLLVLAVIYLLNPSTPTDKIRDIFIIFMALESLVLGLTLVILIVQLARLINLLQNEVKPILESTNETVSTLRGTTEFLSDNLAEPVIKLNEYMAAMQQALKVVGLARGRKSQKNSQGE